MKRFVILAAVIAGVVLAGYAAVHISRRSQRRHRGASYADACPECSLRTAAAYHYRHCTTRHWRPAVLRP